MVRRTLLFICVLLSSVMVSPQFSPQSSGGDNILPPPRNLPPPARDDENFLQEVTQGSLACYSCSLDFRKKKYEWDHPCLGRHRDSEVNKTYLVICGPNDRYCRAERTEVNGVLVRLTRECSEVCYYGCRPKGFGINSEACAQCCETNGCNNMYPESSATLPRANFVALGFVSFVVALSVCCY
ncbi:uncharacterized protein LOC122246334 [Penaeus japonicus]|uniref:uncharacterized protein LOC122246334 n=1 Tax=Penaeus japonicus TaxID=27405 RepID=UPI001C70E3CF|nr:uncharacterized protein LOC122246334 [Penaeus japonicus]